MQNEAGETVDVYIPRKCSASGRIIGARDYAAVQLNIADVDEKTGRVTGGFKTYAVSGFIRAMGESDDCLHRICTRDGICAGEQPQS
uniref:Small ribosomal subunit protein eS21 n=1 Tax=Suberites domuncula TaxID=55567 RepID=RS21_SUBDO|nr:RecName: Full=Small ribosomal subunit protein eS21; AltName: Full=40S ribosomal protein S21 [Suberites domuncula]AAX48898.1 S21 [Suberites domuncula]